MSNYLLKNNNGWINMILIIFATEYNRQHYGKRIKQLKHMLEDENFLSFIK